MNDRCELARCGGSWAILPAILAVCAVLTPASAVEIADKTLVAWVSPANLTQGGGSVLTLENPPGQFDAIVLGEIGRARWMAGSEGFRRTQREQGANPVETAGSGDLVQIAIAYRGKEVAIYRDGKPYASYAMATEPAAFSHKSVVVIGLRHLDASGRRYFFGSIDDARVYGSALDAAALGKLQPNEVAADGPKPIAWWSFEDGKAVDAMKTFGEARLVGKAKIASGRLQLDGGYLVIGVEPPRDRDEESWPTYHVSALPDEGLCRPYDANGCIFWKGRYHLMYIFQHPTRGHSWGHLSSADLVDWTYHPAALVPQPGDPDSGIFSGNAFVDKDGTPWLCWFGIGAGVCIAKAADDDLIRWEKHPKNPIIPIPKAGQPGHGVYKVWDPYLWLEGDTYYCLLGGNQHEDGEDTLYAMKSKDLVTWEPLHRFYRADPSWTVPGEDCSCPDFFRLGDKHVLMCISHKVGGRAYVGRFEKEKFFPERHVRMNWPGGHFFAPESLVDDRGRRIFWAWVTDPRTITTQRSTGSGVQSLPRVLSLADDGTLRVAPVPELERLRQNHRSTGRQAIRADSELTLAKFRGDRLEMAFEIDPGDAKKVGVAVRCSPDGAEQTLVWYDVAAGQLVMDMSRSTRRDDVVYTPGPLDSGGMRRAEDNRNPKLSVEAPFRLGAGEKLRLRFFLDGPMLEVFAADRQCITQQVFPSRADSLGVKLLARGGEATLLSAQAWDMAPAKFVDERGAGGDPAAPGEEIFYDSFDGKLGPGWSWLREHREYWRIQDGALEIHSEPGLAHNVKNALLRDAPDRRTGKYAIDVTVRNMTPAKQQYEQLGITWYSDGKPVFKLVKERVNGKNLIVPGFKELSTDTVQLRLIVTASTWEAQYRPNGKGEFLTAAKGKLRPPGKDQISIQCYHGPTDAVHWMRFDDFRIWQIAD